VHNVTYNTFKRSLSYPSEMSVPPSCQRVVLVLLRCVGFSGRMRMSGRPRWDSRTWESGSPTCAGKRSLVRERESLEGLVHDLSVGDQTENCPNTIAGKQMSVRLSGWNGVDLSNGQTNEREKKERQQRAQLKRQAETMKRHRAVPHIPQTRVPTAK